MTELVLQSGDAVTGEHFSNSSTKGLDIEHALQYGRTKGGEKLRKMNFHERGRMLKKLALHLLTKKKAFYELSYRTGATKIDSWIPYRRRNRESICQCIAP